MVAVGSNKAGYLKTNATKAAVSHPCPRQGTRFEIASMIGLDQVLQGRLPWIETYLQHSNNSHYVLETKVQSWPSRPE